MTPPFRFRLERVRELRQHDEDRAKEELAAGLGAQLRGEALLRAASSLVDEARTGTPALSGIAMPAAALVAHQRWLERVERDRAQAAVERDRAAAEVERRRAALVEAMRRRQALDRLRDRRRQEHRVRAERAEGAILDEIAIAGHVRQMRAAG